MNQKAEPMKSKSLLESNKICAIVGCFPRTNVHSALLSLTLASLKTQGYKICLVSHHPVNPDIQQAVNYFLYSDENEVLPDITSSFYIYFNTDDFRYQSNNFPSLWSYAILLNIKNSLNFLKEKNFTHFIYFENDSFLNHQDHALLKKMLLDSDLVNKDFWFMNESFSTGGLFPVTSIFAGKIDFFMRILSEVASPEDFLKSSQPAHCLEWFFKNKIQNLSTGHIEQTNPRTCFTSEWIGISNSGLVKIPGLKIPSFTLDVVKVRNDEEVIAFIFRLQSQNGEPLVLEAYINDILVFSEHVLEDSFRWYLRKATREDSIRFHCLNSRSEILGTFTSSGSKILENELAFFEFINHQKQTD